MREFQKINLLDLIAQAGEDKVRTILNTFDCKKNLEVENFVRSKAIDFAKKKVTITHLLTDETDVLAMFALTHKAIDIKSGSLTHSFEKRLAKYVPPENDGLTYKASGFLLAQFGKNYGVNNGKSITGNEIMNSVFEVVRNVQHEVGGRLLYLECENKKRLLDFYQNENNGFKCFDERFSKEENLVYEQLIKIL